MASIAPAPDVREFVDRGFGLPLFEVGQELEINGTRVVIVQIQSQLGHPKRVVVEVEIA